MSYSRTQDRVQVFHISLASHQLRKMDDLCNHSFTEPAVEAAFLHAWMQVLGQVGFNYENLIT